MTGRRLPDGGNPAFAPGDYWRDGDGVWWVRPPQGHMGPLTDHEVIEHEDGTITVSPSIDSPGEWHGYLERGLWRACSGGA
jgi:hypothetical protein